MGMDIGFSCGNNSTCINACAADTECQVFPLAECTTNQDCEDMFLGTCIELGDTDGCVMPMMMDCVAPQIMIDVMDVDGNTVSVCGNDLTCQDLNGDMVCAGEPVEFTCDDLMCPDPLTCDDAEPACNCAETQDCMDAGLPGECLGGFCIDACEGDADCEGMTSTFDGGMFVCQ